MDPYSKEAGRGVNAGLQEGGGVMNSIQQLCDPRSPERVENPYRTAGGEYRSVEGSDSIFGRGDGECCFAKLTKYPSRRQTNLLQ